VDWFHLTFKNSATNIATCAGLSFAPFHGLLILLLVNLAMAICGWSSCMEQFTFWHSDYISSIY